MKTISLIPQKVKKTYRIRKRGNYIEVRSPAYVNIDCDKEFKITKNEEVIIFKNSKCRITLWKKVKMQHITIY